MKNIMLVEAEIWTVARTDKGNAVLVKPLGSDRAVPIFIGQLEAQSILIGLGKVPMPRPLTHDLMITILEKLGMTVERIEINDLKDATFYARIIARQGMKKFVFDSRPSDALSLATRVKCPVYIAEYIVDEASIPISMISESDQMSQSVNKSVLEELQRALETAVEEENYEEAARIRDRIREVEEEMSEGSDQVMEDINSTVEFNVFDEDDYEELEEDSDDDSGDFEDDDGEDIESDR
jgi:bifunctional DNase/RNase